MHLRLRAHNDFNASDENYLWDIRNVAEIVSFPSNTLCLLFPFIHCAESLLLLAILCAELLFFSIPFSHVEESPIKRCPLCHVPIERNDGCAQMMCKRCKHVFCWYCLASLDVSLFPQFVSKWAFILHLHCGNTGLFSPILFTKQIFPQLESMMLKSLFFYLKIILIVFFSKILPLKIETRRKKKWRKVVFPSSTKVIGFSCSTCLLICRTL